MSGQNILFLHSKNLNMQDVQEILDIVANNPNAHSLILNNNELKDEGVEVLVKGLMAYPNITHLALRDNKLSDQSCRYLSELSHIKDLDLSNNNITDQGVLAVDVESLSIAGTNVTHNAVSDIIQNHPRLKTLDLPSECGARVARCADVLLMRRDQSENASSGPSFLRGLSMQNKKSDLDDAVQDLSQAISEREHEVSYESSGGAQMPCLKAV